MSNKFHIFCLQNQQITLLQHFYLTLRLTDSACLSLNYINRIHLAKTEAAPTIIICHRSHSPLARLAMLALSLVPCALRLVPLALCSMP
jgi:hypothetical protein